MPGAVNNRVGVTVKASEDGVILVANAAALMVNEGFRLVDERRQAWTGASHRTPATGPRHT